MARIEDLISMLQSLSPMGVLLFVFLVAYIENIFPPSPSDVLLVCGGTLIGVGTVGFIPALLSATLGSTLGFMTAYLAGRYFGRRITEGRFARFLPVSAIYKVERWFQRFGYGVIVANRFLAGTRAVVSFFAGMARMNLMATTVLCAVSAGLWNALLLYLGMVFGKNWHVVADYLTTYSTIVTVVVIVVILILLLWYLKQRRDTSRKAAVE
jgi:membrane protein DedA with SNARE-associated domain